MYRLGSEDRRYKEERIKQSAFGKNSLVVGWWVVGPGTCFKGEGGDDDFTMGF